MKQYFQRQLLRAAYKLALSKKRRLASVRRPMSVAVVPPNDGWMHGDHYSFGDEMLVLGLLNGLRRFPNISDVTVIGLNGRSNGPMDFHGHQIQRWSFENGWLGLSSYSELQHLLSRKTHFVLVGADVLDGAYGSLDSVQRLRFLNLALKEGVQSAITGCSFSGNGSPEIRDLLGRAAANGATIHAREPVSQKRLESFLPEVVPAADLAFLADSVPLDSNPLIEAVAEKVRQAECEGYVTLGLNLCGWHIPLPHAPFFEQLACALEASDQKLALILLPHDTREERRSDLATLEEFQRVLNKRVLVLNDPSHVKNGPVARGLVSLCDALLTGRMHLAIAAHDQGVPAVSFSYQGKFEGLYDLFQFGPGFTVTYSDVKGVSVALNRLLSTRQQLVEKLSQQKAAVRTAALRNFDWVGEQL